MHAGRQRREDVVEEDVHVGAGHQDVAGIDEQDVARGKRRERREAGILHRLRMSLAPVPSMSARGAGSIAVISVASPPSRTARAMKRVEWPEPTSTIRAGFASRTST